jgi:ribose transport system substrate-binding protein
MDPLLRQARQAGIAVVLGNADGDDDGLRDAFVGPVNAELGNRAAELAAELLEGQGKVAIIGFLGRSPRTRAHAFRETLVTDYPEIELTATASTDGSIASAYASTTAVLTAHPDTDLIYIPEGGSPLTVASAVREQGLSGRVKVIGMGRSQEMLAAIADGTVTASVVQDTYAEEYIALHFLYWKYNNVTAVPDTTVIRARLESVPLRLHDTAFPISKAILERTCQGGNGVRSVFADRYSLEDHVSAS